MQDFFSGGSVVIHWVFQGKTLKSCHFFSVFFVCFFLCCCFLGFWGFFWWVYGDPLGIWELNIKKKDVQCIVKQEARKQWFHVLKHKNACLLWQVRDALQHLVWGMQQPHRHGCALQCGKKQGWQLLHHPHLQVPHEVPSVWQLLWNPDRPQGDSTVSFLVVVFHLMLFVCLFLFLFFFFFFFEAKKKIFVSSHLTTLLFLPNPNLFYLWRIKKRKKESRWSKWYKEHWQKTTNQKNFQHTYPIFLAQWPETKLLLFSFCLNYQSFAMFWSISRVCYWSINQSIIQSVQQLNKCVYVTFMFEK